MKRLAIFCFITIFLFSCGSKSDKVERIWVDGVEVVINHLKPYKINGQPSELILEEELVIDTERDEMAEIRLGDMFSFDVDSEESIYFRVLKNVECLFYKFDRQGNFVKCFGRKGQGPGEFQFGPLIAVNFEDKILIKDPAKIVFFDKGGNFIKEIQKDFVRIRMLAPLKNGNYLAYSIELVPDDPKIFDCTCLGLYDSEFKKIKEIGRIVATSPYIGKGMSGVRDVVFMGVSESYFFAGNSRKGYEIDVYDLDGRLIRKIKKEYKPVPVTKEYKKSILEPRGRNENDGSRYYFPKDMPPFQSLFADDEGWLFVRTYEEKNPQEYIYDIFNPDGIFVTRKSIEHFEIDIRGLPSPKCIKVKNNRLYCIREKESGYKELVVYKMKWEGENKIKR